MALMFTNLDNDMVFEFQEHEYPESLPLNLKTKLNEIEYPDDHYTNQIIGTKPGEIRFKGTFFGTYLVGGVVVSAKERSDELEKLMKTVVRIQYAVGGFAGNAQTVIIAEYNRDIRNYFDVDYELILKPHEPQTRVVPAKVSNVSISPDASPKQLVTNVATKKQTTQTKVEKQAGKKPDGKPDAKKAPEKPKTPTGTTDLAAAARMLAKGAPKVVKAVTPKLKP